MNRIITIDPGVASGLCVVDYISGEQAFEIVEQGELNQFDTCAWLEAYLEEGPVESVICETFTITQRTLKLSRQPASLEIIGAARYLTLKQCGKFLMQSPADAKRFSTDKRLKACGLWHSTKGGHANDAARHMMLRLCKLGVIRASELDSAS